MEWPEKYSTIKELKTNSNPRIKTYTAKRTFIMKKIHFVDENEKRQMIGFIEYMKNIIKIFDVYEEFSFINVILDSNDKDSRIFDESFEKYKKSNFSVKESNVKGHANYSSLEEIEEYYSNSENNIFHIEFFQCGIQFRGTAFILEIDKKYNLPFKKALITCNHNIDDETLKYTDIFKMYNKKKEKSEIDLENTIIYTVSKYNELNEKEKKN